MTFGDRKAPLAPGKPLKRTGFKAKTPPARGGFAARSAPLRKVSAKKAKSDRQLRSLYPALEARSGGRCELRVPDVCTGDPNDPHHVLRRPHMHGVHVLALIRVACRPCHDWVHGHIDLAVENGWLIRSTDATEAPS